jgi:DNA sulfur modification protein DndC
VEQDKSMQAMIQNDEEKEWMLPLLELRNELDLQDDRGLRDFRRMSGLVQLHNDRAIPGPYTQESRELWLRRLLEAQRWVRENGPEHVGTLELITMPELHEIRRLWVVEKHEIEDRLPLIYEEVMAEPFPGGRLDDASAFGDDEMQLLREVCGDALHFQLVRELISVEHRFQTSARRAGLHEALESAFRRGSYADEEDALDMARRRRTALERVRGDLDADQLYLLDDDLILLADDDPAV